MSKSYAMTLDEFKAHLLIMQLYVLLVKSNLVTERTNLEAEKYLTESLEAIEKLQKDD